MAAYPTIYDAATDETSNLIKQVAVAMNNAATNVLNEDPGTENHNNRIAWARRIKEEEGAPIAFSKRWVWSVLENPSIANAPISSPDNDVQFVVDALVNTMARLS